MIVEIWLSRLLLSLLIAVTYNPFLHTWPEFPWTRPGLGNVALHEGGVRRLSCMMPGHLSDVMVSVFDFTTSVLTSVSAKRFDVNVLDRSVEGQVCKQKNL